MIIINVVLYVIFAFIFLNYWLLPKLQPPDLLIGARVTEDFKKEKGKEIIKGYRLSLLGVTALSLIVSYFLGFFSVLIYSILLIIIVIYWRKVVIKSRGTLPTITIRYFIVDTERKINRSVIIPLSVAWIIFVSTMIFGLVFYSSAPQLIPYHVSGNGYVSYVLKTPLNYYRVEIVNAIVLTLFTLLGTLVVRTSNLVNPSYPKESYVAFKKFKEGIMILLGIVSIFVSLTFTSVSLFVWTIITSYQFEIIITTFLSLMFVLISSLIIRIGVEGASYLGEVKVSEGVLMDDKYWKGGIIYVNPKDPRIWVPKRNGVGYTLNFGHITSILIFLSIIFFALLIVVIAVK
ncbi:DUF5808 domain-containing protein [Sulfolobus tengchongensis]|uniref:DUF5808 domain-containing protein n=1 Tax=Sulfolobus tengchongensis TaxID=207809 RepID=A0AAX4KWM6_9CREN